MYTLIVTPFDNKFAVVLRIKITLFLRDTDRIGISNTCKIEKAVNLYLVDPDRWA